MYSRLYGKHGLPWGLVSQDPFPASLSLHWCDSLLGFFLSARLLPSSAGPGSGSSFRSGPTYTDVCTFSNGCLNENLDRQVDAGAARIVGLEAFAEGTFRPGGGVTFPTSLSYTFTQTRLLEDFRSEDPQYGLVRAGDEMPYVPRHQLFASAGVESARGGVHLSATFVGPTAPGPTLCARCWSG
jgi:hypothetical protein